MAQPTKNTARLTSLSDEDLAAECAKGIDSAERELLNRYMQVIYWLPHRAFGAPEETLSDFLLYAVEKLRTRDSCSKYVAGRGAKFRTWFGVVLRNLYRDYLRTQKDEPREISLDDQHPAPLPPPDPAAESLLDKMQIRCRALFKLLLCNTFFLGSDDIRWIAETSGRSLLEVSRAVAELEEKLRHDEVRIRERYDKLTSVSWYLTHYERQLARLETKRTLATPEEIATILMLETKLARRREEHRRLLAELAGGAGLATAPYRELATLLNMKEGTLASQISRCRTGAAELFAVEQDHDQTTNEGNSA